jgi:translation elongation factor EF-4
MVKYDLPLNEVVFDFYDRLDLSQGLCLVRLSPDRLQAG